MYFWFSFEMLPLWLQIVLYPLKLINDVTVWIMRKIKKPENPAEKPVDPFNNSMVSDGFDKNNQRHKNITKMSDYKKVG